MASARITYWYLQAFWKKYKKIVLASVILGVFLVWLFPALIQLMPSRRNVQFIGRVGLYTFLELPDDIQEKMSVGLTGLNEQGQPVPMLAQRWTMEEDGKAFRFLLKENLRWQDGRPFTAEDVNYNFTDVQTVVTDNSILFRLQDAYAPFPTVVSQPLFRQEQRTRFRFFRQNAVIGLGEYEVLNLKYQNAYVKELVLENDTERLIYRFYPSEQEAAIAMRRGEVDSLEHLSSLQDFTEAELESFEESEKVNLNQFVGVFFNTTDPFLSKEVRQALNYATHKPEASDSRLRALGPIAPISWAYNSTEEINPFGFNMNQAVELYREVSPQTALELNLDSALAFLPEAQQIEQDWEALGQAAIADCEARRASGDLSSEERDLPCDRYAINITTRVLQDLQDLQAALIAREVPADPDQYGWWHSTQATNISRYQNPRVDKLLEDARKETDQQKRKVLYFEFQRYLVEDVPVIFMYHLPEYSVARKNYF